MLKELIKKLSAEQVELKQKRKTGPYVCTWSRGCGYRDAPEAVKNSGAAASKAQLNRARITAALNLRHEMRGSTYRHGVGKTDKCEYKYVYNELFLQVTACIAKGDYVG